MRGSVKFSWVLTFPEDQNSWWLFVLMSTTMTSFWVIDACYSRVPPLPSWFGYLIRGLQSLFPSWDFMNPRDFRRDYTHTSSIASPAYFPSWWRSNYPSKSYQLTLPCRLHVGTLGTTNPYVHGLDDNNFWSDTQFLVFNFITQRLHSTPLLPGLTRELRLPKNWLCNPYTLYQKGIQVLAMLTSYSLR